MNIAVIDDAGFGLKGGKGIYGKEVYAELLVRINEDYLNNNTTRILLGSGTHEPGIKVEKITGSTTPIIRVFRDPSLTNKLLEIIRREKIELLHTNIINPRYVNPILKVVRKTGAKLVVTAHSWNYLCPTGWKIKHPESTICRIAAPSLKCIRCIYGFSKKYHYSFKNKLRGLLQTYLLKKLLISADASIAPSKFFCEEAYRETGIRPYYIPNPVNPAYLELGGDIRYDDYAVFIGRLEYEKGAHLLPEIAKYIDPIKLHVVGSGRLLEFLKQHKTRNMVIHGYLGEEEKRRLLSNAGVVVFPSIWIEMFGIVVIEAFIYRKPVVAFRIGGPAELIEASGGGILIDTYNTKELAMKTRELVNDKEHAKRLGLNAYKWLSENLHPRSYADKLRRIYDTVMAQ